MFLLYQSPVKVHEEMLNSTIEYAAQNVTPTIIFLLSLTSSLSIRNVQAMSLYYYIVPKPWVLIALFYARAAA